jgi:hypothetical protein
MRILDSFGIRPIDAAAVNGRWASVSAEDVLPIETASSSSKTWREDSERPGGMAASVPTEAAATEDWTMRSFPGRGGRGRCPCGWPVPSPCRWGAATGCFGRDLCTQQRSARARVPSSHSICVLVRKYLSSCLSASVCVPAASVRAPCLHDDPFLLSHMPFFSREKHTSLRLEGRDPPLERTLGPVRPSEPSGCAMLAASVDAMLHRSACANTVHRSPESQPLSHTSAHTALRLPSLKHTHTVPLTMSSRAQAQQADWPTACHSKVGRNGHHGSGIFRWFTPGPSASRPRRGEACPRPPCCARFGHGVSLAQHHGDCLRESGCGDSKERVAPRRRRLPAPAISASSHGIRFSAGRCRQAHSNDAERTSERCLPRTCTLHRCILYAGEPAWRQISPNRHDSTSPHTIHRHDCACAHDGGSERRQQRAPNDLDVVHPTCEHDARLGPRTNEPQRAHHRAARTHNSCCHVQRLRLGTSLPSTLC